MPVTLDKTYKKLFESIRVALAAKADTDHEASYILGELESLSRELKYYKSVADLAKSLIHSRPIEDISDLVLVQAKRLTESRYGYVGYMDPRTGYLVCPTLTKDAWGSCPIKDKTIIFNKFDGLWGWVLQNKRTLLTNSPEEDSRRVGIPKGHVPIKRFLSAPVVLNGALTGQIAVANSERDYNEQDKKLVENLADIYALALDQQMSGDNYRTIFSSASDAIVVHDMGNAAIIDVNDKFCELFGYTREEAMTLDIGAISSNIPPYDQKGALNNLQMAKRDALPPIFQWMNKAKSGKLFWTEVSVKTGIVIGGRACVLAIVRDVSQRKETEDALKRSERELKILSSKLISVQENEKKRIARELHDSVGQSLAAIKFSIEDYFESTPRGGSHADNDFMKRIVTMIQKTMSEVRRVTMDLRPATLDNRGIVATINWFCREFQNVYSYISVEKNITLKEGDIPQRLKTTIFRIIQEGFNNIAKHSQADKISLSLRKAGHTIQLTIEDNGHGFDVQEALALEGSRRGLGLASMRERVEITDGVFSVRSEVGRGTTLRATWPDQFIIDIQGSGSIT